MSLEKPPTPGEIPESEGTPLTVEEELALDEFGVSAEARENMTPEQAREKLRMLDWKPKDPYEKPREDLGSSEKEYAEGPLTADEVRRMLKYNIDMSVMRGGDNTSRLRAELKVKEEADPNKEVEEEAVPTPVEESKKEALDEEIDPESIIPESEVKKVKKLFLEVNLMPGGGRKVHPPGFFESFAKSVSKKRDAILNGIGRLWEKRKKKELTPEEKLQQELEDRFFTDEEIAEMTPEKKEVALLFESAHAMEGAKLRHDPIWRFASEVMHIDPTEIGFLYTCIDIKTLEINEGVVVGGRRLDFINYHDFLTYRESLSEKDKEKVDGNWGDLETNGWNSPDFRAFDEFWNRLEKGGDLHQYVDRFWEIRRQVLAGEVKNTFVEEVEKRKAKKAEAKMGDDLGNDKPKDVETHKVPKGTKASRRGERFDRWHEMSEEEKQEKYGRSLELREKRYRLDAARANLTVLENEHNQNQSLLGKVEKSKVLRIVDEQDYLAAKLLYEELRAEYVGAKTWRVLKEKQRLAEEEAQFHQEGRFESFRKNWRKLGNANIEVLLGKKGIKLENRFAKFVARSLNARLLISLSLLGGGVALGMGSAVGIGAIATRRAMAGTSAGFGFYDFTSLASEKLLLSNIDSNEMDTVAFQELEEMMAVLEARAKYSGERIVHSEKYQALRREYHKRQEHYLSGVEPGDEDERKRIIHADLLRLDNDLRKDKSIAKRLETSKKVISFGVGAFVGSGLLAGLLGKRTGLEGITEEEIQEAIQEGPAMPPEVVQKGIEQEAKVTKELLEAADRIEVLDITDTGSAADSASDAGADSTNQGGASDLKEGGEPPFKQPLTGTVKQGGSAWQAAREIIGTGEGKITEEQFRVAWSSAASTIKLESGQTIHISELGLTHVGDQVVYVPATENLEAYFRVIDYTEDQLHIGSNQDLAAAFEAEGKDIPQWLQDSIGAEEEVVSPTSQEATIREVVGLSRDEVQSDATIREIVGLSRETTPPEGIISPEEAFEKATEGTLEFGPETYNFKWGDARFIYDGEGRIVDITTRENLSPARRVKLVNKATEEYLRPNYLNIPQAKEEAWRLENLIQAFKSVRNQDGPEGNFLRYRINYFLDLNIRKFRPESISKIKLDIK